MKITVQIAMEPALGQPEVIQQVAHLETKFAALMSYGLSVQLLQEVLPIGTVAPGLSCAVKRARWSRGRKLSHPATVAPAGNNRSGSGR